MILYLYVCKSQKLNDKCKIMEHKNPKAPCLCKMCIGYAGNFLNTHLQFSVP